MRYQETIRLNSTGFTILELIVVLFITLILATTAIPSFAALKNPLDDGIATTLGVIKQTRAKAIATTSAYKIQASTNSHIYTQYLSKCNANTSTADSKLTLDLPIGVALTSNTWSICFDSRGFAQSAQNITLYNQNGKMRTIEVFLGGAARIQP